MLINNFDTEFSKGFRMKKGSLKLNLLNLSLINYVHHFPPPRSDTRTLEGKLILVRTN